MIVVRLLVVAFGIGLVALLLAWLFTGQRKYLGYAGRLFQFALVVAVIAALFFVVERMVLR
jgi:hypothetical protein